MKLQHNSRLTWQPISHHIRHQARFQLARLHQARPIRLPLHGPGGKTTASRRTIPWVTRARCASSRHRHLHHGHRILRCLPCCPTQRRLCRRHLRLRLRLHRRHLPPQRHRRHLPPQRHRWLAADYMHRHWQMRRCALKYEYKASFALSPSVIVDSQRCVIRMRPLSLPAHMRLWWSQGSAYRRLASTQCSCTCYCKRVHLR